MDIKDIAGIASDLIETNDDRNKLYDKIDKAVACEFSPSAALTELPFVKNRHYALTDIADARNAGVRTFAVLMPSIEVTPNADNEFEYDRVERMETALEWEFQRMNRNGSDTVHSRIIKSAINYHAVALQTQYLPYHYKSRKNEPRIKATLRQRNFNWIVHHPASVHVLRDIDDTMTGVLKVGVYTADQLVNEYGEDNPGIAKMKQYIDGKRADWIESEWTLLDWWDWDRRQTWAIPNDTSSYDITDYVLMDEEHGLSFIPWVVIDKGDPLWRSVIESGMWDNLQHMNVIRFAKAIEQAAAPSGLIQTPDGTLKGVWLDPSTPMNFLQIPAGAQYRELQRPQIDPQLETHYQELRAAIQRSTVSQVLTDIGQYSNAPFSTVNQIVQMALGQLGPAKLVAEEAESRGLYQMFEWIEHSKIPLIAYRQKDSDGNTGQEMRRGEEIGIFPGEAKEPPEDATTEELERFRRRIYFDLSALYINVTLNSQNTADEQARQNVIINAIDRMGASKEWGWEKMGYKNYQLIQEQRASEVLEDAEIQKIVQMKQLEVQMMAQEAQMQMQIAAQQQAQPNPNQSVTDMNTMGMEATTQGADMRGGMNPAAMQNPSMTREAATGQDSIGAEI